MLCSNIDWLNGVLRRFQQYFSHITATAHIIHVFPGFHQYQAGLWSVLPKDTAKENLDDPVRLEPRTPGLQVKHLITELRGTLLSNVENIESQNKKCS